MILKCLLFILSVQAQAAIDCESTGTEYVTLGANVASLQNVTGGTITAWVNVESNAADRYVAHFSAGTGSLDRTRLGLASNAAGEFFSFARRTDAEAVNIVTSVSTLTLGTWVHVATVAEYNNAILRIYINGVQDNTVAIAGWTGATSNTPSQQARICGRGDDAAGEVMDGRLDSVKIFNRALTANEILNEVGSRGKEGVSSGLVGWWTFREGAAGGAASGTAYDWSNSKLNGTYTNTPTFSESVLRFVRGGF